MISILRLVVPSNEVVNAYCRDILMASIPADARLVEVVQDETIVRDLTRNFLINLICGLNQCHQGIVYLCDCDCLYPPSHFASAINPGIVTYLHHGYYLIADASIGANKPIFMRRKRVVTAELAGDRDILLCAYHAKLRRVINSANRWRAELLADDYVQVMISRPKHAWIDIRHGKNATSGERRVGHETAPALEHWGKAEQLWRAMTK